MPYPTHLLPTTVVGSYPQPDWLVDRAALEQHGVPRTHAHDIWRIAGAELLEQAQDDGTILAIRDMERAGIDIITDGEIRRESYSNRFALALEGIDAEQPGRGALAGRAASRRCRAWSARSAGAGRWRLRDAEFLLRQTDRATKITLPGPFTLSQQAQNEFYRDEEEMAMDYAVAVNEELRALKATGVDVVQLDEPWVRTAPDKAERYGVRAINRALEGIDGPTVVHLCFGYAARGAEQAERLRVPAAACRHGGATDLDRGGAAEASIWACWRDLSGKQIMLGVLDLGDAAVETAEQVADRIRAGLRFVAAGTADPGAGLRHEVPAARAAFGKLRALAEGAAIVRRELAG